MPDTLRRLAGMSRTQTRLVTPSSLILMFLELPFAIFMVTFMVYYILPTFVSLFEALQVALPGTTGS